MKTTSKFLAAALLATSLSANAYAPGIALMGSPLEIELDSTHSLVVRNLESNASEVIYLDLNNDGKMDIRLVGYKTSEPYVQVSYVVNGKSIGISHAKVYKKA